jgi:phage I-like protein
MNNETEMITGDLLEIVIGADDAGGGAKRVMLVPVDDKGVCHSSNGDSTLTAADAEKVIAEFNAKNRDTVIDFEHQTLPEFERADKLAPAAGWIKSLIYKAGEGLFGMVEWTDQAREMIRAKQYKYLSPVFLVDKAAKHIVRFVSAGLTNEPAIVGMPAVAAKENPEMDKEPKKKEKDKATEKVVNQDEVGGDVAAAQLLGKVEGALEAAGVTLDGTDPASILTAALEFIKAKSGEAAEPEETAAEAVEEAANVRQELGLDADAKTEVVMSTIKASKAHVGFTKNEEVTAMRERLDVLEKQGAEDAGAKLLETYKMKLNPNDEDQMKWARETAVTDPEGFERMVKNAPDALPPQGQTTGTPATGTRETVINAAKAEWTAHPEVHPMSTQTDWVFGAVRDKGLLTEAEEKSGALAVG